ncbi:MAG: hypothetical protein JSS93_03980 [Bacteroidetes bacterium]|nr:hypothetical protein [Bacteroidota bacterium]
MSSKLIFVVLYVVVSIIIQSCKPVASYNGPNRQLILNTRKSFLIYFAGYDGERVTLRLNDKTIFSNRRLKNLKFPFNEPDSILRKDQNSYVKFDNGSLIVQVLGKIESPNTRFDFSSKLRIEIIVDDQAESKTISLSKGRIVYLDYGNVKLSDTNYVKKVRFVQYAKLPESE